MLAHLSRFHHLFDGVVDERAVVVETEVGQHVAPGQQHGDGIGNVFTNGLSKWMTGTLRMKPRIGVTTTNMEKSIKFNKEFPFHKINAKMYIH